MTMIHQRRPGSAPVVQASATELPFRDDGFAAALAILTVHHWPDQARGLDELARVARRRIVVVTWDPSTSGFWLVDDYFPEIWAIDRPILIRLRSRQTPSSSQRPLSRPLTGSSSPISRVASAAGTSTRGSG